MPARLPTVYRRQPGRQPGGRTLVVTVIEATAPHVTAHRAKETHTMAAIDEFFAHKRYALVEIDPTAGFGQAVYDGLVKGGREAVLVMAAPATGAQHLLGTVYPSVTDVPAPLDGVILNIEGDPDRMLREVQAAA